MAPARSAAGREERVATRDGEEIDFLVETEGRIYPIEVKLGTPSPKGLPKLARIAGPSWQRGQVVTLGLTEPHDLTDEWRATPPWGLRFD